METMYETFLIFEDAYNPGADVIVPLLTAFNFIACRKREWTFIYIQG